MLKNIRQHFRPTETDGRKPLARGHISHIFFTFATMKRYLQYVIFLLFAFVSSGGNTAAQQAGRRTTPTEHVQKILKYTVEGNDTIYMDTLPAAKIYDRLPRQKGREWRKYYRLVHNFSKVYPYALVARKIVERADSTISTDALRGMKREKYINGIQNELFDAFETPMRNMTISQGALLMRLIDREVGKSSYSIIKDYKSGIAAGFWQGIAKLFGTDLKAPYNPEGVDRETEELVAMWERGEFEGLYYSLFWEWPRIPEIPSKYR